MSTTRNGTRAKPQAWFLAQVRIRLASFWEKLRKNKTSYLMLAPFFIPFILFTVIAVLVAVFFSFTYYNVLEPPVWVGWQNYASLLLEDDIFIIALRNTFVFVMITGPFGYIMSFVAAWFVNELPPRVRSIITLALYAPVLAGGAGFAIFQFMFSGSQYGIINGLLIRLGIILEPIFFLRDQDWILPLLIIVQLWLSLSFSFLAFIAGLQSVDKNLYEAAAIDGVKNRFQELWYVTLPVMRPYLMFGAVMQITQSFAVSLVSINLFGMPTTNYAGRTVVTHLVDHAVLRFEMGYASAIATLLFVIMVAFNKGVQRYLRKIGT
jgi:multiple sugar transport system permease protein